jgi:hypothetical protein
VCEANCAKRLDITPAEVRQLTVSEVVSASSCLTLRALIDDTSTVTVRELHATMLAAGGWREPGRSQLCSALQRV